MYIVHYIHSTVYHMHSILYTWYNIYIVYYITVYIQYIIYSAASQAPRWTGRPRLELRCGWPELLPAGRPKAIKKKVL